MLSKKTLKNLAGFGISAALIVWLVSTISFDKLFEHLATVNYWMLLPGIACLIVHFFLRAYRWHYLLPEQHPAVSTRVLFDSIMIGNFATYILPLRAGEFIRPFLLSRTSGYSFASGFASVVVERFFDLAAVLLTFAYVITQVDSMPDWVRPGALILGGLAVGILVFMILGSLMPEFVMNLSKKILSILPAKIQSLLLNFLGDLLKSVQVINNVSNLLKIIISTTLVWLTCYLSFYFFLFMFPGDFTFLMALTLAVIIALAVAAPSAPGFVGVYQSACVAGFQVFGFPMEMAIAFSLITHFINYLMFGLFALFYILSKNMSFSEVLRKQESV